MENIDNPHNEQFKAWSHEYKAKPMRKRLMQADEDAAQEAQVAIEEVEDEDEDPGVCPISLNVDTRTNLYMVMYGFVQGLYPTAFYP